MWKDCKNEDSNLMIEILNVSAYKLELASKLLKINNFIIFWDNKMLLTFLLLWNIIIWVALSVVLLLHSYIMNHKSKFVSTQDNKMILN